MNSLEKVIRHFGLYKLIFHFLNGHYPCDIVDEKVCRQELVNFNPDIKSSCVWKYDMKTNQVKVSIIVPAYNASNYIVECLRSLVTQKTTYSYEIIVINDGSTDDTLERIKSVKCEKIKIIDKPNGGISSARNAGITNAYGEYLIFCDADDYMDERAIQHLIERAEKTDADIVEGTYRYVSETGQMGHAARHKSARGKSVNTFGVPWCKCIRKSLFRGVCFPDYWFEDSVIHHIILPRANRIEWIDDVVYYYRTNSNGATSNITGNPKSVDSLWISISLFGDRKNLNIPKSVEYYKYMLGLLRLGFHRTKSLPTKIRKDFYYMYASFLNRNFDTQKFGLADLDYANIQRLITKVNYLKYCEYFSKT